MRKVLRNKKGFTLVEIIVVLVILAILAAATIPAMIGFVNDARGKAFVAEARVGLSAAQAAVTEVLASNPNAAVSIDGVISGTGTALDTTNIVNHPTFVGMVQDVTGASVNLSASPVVFNTNGNPFSNIVVSAPTANPANRVTGIRYDSDPAGASGSQAFVVTISNGQTNVARETKS